MACERADLPLRLAPTASRADLAAEGLDGVYASSSGR